MSRQLGRSYTGHGFYYFRKRLILNRAEVRATWSTSSLGIDSYILNVSVTGQGIKGGGTTVFLEYEL